MQFWLRNRDLNAYGNVKTFSSATYKYSLQLQLPQQSRSTSVQALSIRSIKKLVKKGLKHVRFGPPLGPDPEKTIRLIGENIIPHLKEL